MEINVAAVEDYLLGKYREEPWVEKEITTYAMEHPKEYNELLYQSWNNVYTPPKVDAEPNSVVITPSNTKTQEPGTPTNPAIAPDKDQSTGASTGNTKPSIDTNKPTTAPSIDTELKQLTASPGPNGTQASTIYFDNGVATYASDARDAGYGRLTQLTPADPDYEATGNPLISYMRIVEVCPGKDNPYKGIITDTYSDIQVALDKLQAGQSNDYKLSKTDITNLRDSMMGSNKYSIFESA